MIPISLQDITRMAGGLLLQGNPSLKLDNCHFDSRQVSARGLFIAVQGGARDGHEFILQAYQQGAAAAMVSDQAQIPAELPKEFGLILVNDTLRGWQKLAEKYRDQFQIPFIAVTGSTGKTSTKDMIAHVLSAKYETFKTYKNMNNHLGIPLSLLQLKPEDELAVVELGMNHAGEIDLLADIVKPRISVIINITDAHREHFGTREKIALAKAELLDHTDPHGFVLLNADDPYLRMISHLYPGDILYYSITQKADIWADNIVMEDTGTSFDVHFRTGEQFRAQLPLWGKHNVENALPAIAIARHFGMSEHEIQAALANVVLSSMRFEVRHTNAGAVFINDAYNASPTSMHASIDTFMKILKSHKKLLVLGDMYELGENSEALHIELGTYLNEHRDALSLVVTIGELNRVTHAAYQGEKQHFATKEDAIPLLHSLDQSGNALLFKASRGVKFETMITALLEQSSPA